MPHFENEIIQTLERKDVGKSSRRHLFVGKLKVDGEYLEEGACLFSQLEYKKKGDTNWRAGKTQRIPLTAVDKMLKDCGGQKGLKKLISG